MSPPHHMTHGGTARLSGPLPCLDQVTRLSPYQVPFPTYSCATLKTDHMQSAWNQPDDRWLLFLPFPQHTYRKHWAGWLSFRYCWWALLQDEYIPLPAKKTLLFWVSVWLGGYRQCWVIGPLLQTDCWLSRQNKLMLVLWINCLLSSKIPGSFMGTGKTVGFTFGFGQLQLWQCSVVLLWIP